MEKVDYLLASINNIQSLIQFADQKVSAVLVVVSITIGIFISKIDCLYFSYKDITFLSVSLFIICLSFIVINLIVLFLGLIKVIKPSFAKYYKKGDTSLFYFEHIASNNRENIFNYVNELNKNRMEKELAEQLFEISKILTCKHKRCNCIINLLFASIIILILFLILIKYS